MTLADYEEMMREKARAAQLANASNAEWEMQAEVSAVLAEFDRVANAGAVGGSTFRACCARLRAVVGEGKANE